MGEVPPFRGNVALAHRGDRFSARVEAQVQDALERVDPDLNERPLSGWVTVNLSAGWQINEYFSLSGGMDNVLDATYAVANAYVRDPFSSGVVVHEPGRFLFGRLSARF